jgi:hypothetical protein
MAPRPHAGVTVLSITVSILAYNTFATPSIVFDGTEDGVQLVQVLLAYVEVTPTRLRKGLKLLSGFHQPLQPGQLAPRPPVGGPLARRVPSPSPPR